MKVFKAFVIVSALAAVMVGQATAKDSGVGSQGTCPSFHIGICISDTTIPEASGTGDRTAKGMCGKQTTEDGVTDCGSIPACGGKGSAE